MPLMHAHHVSHRNVDVACLIDDSLALVQAVYIQSFQIVHSVGEFDQNYTDIARRRDQHASDILCLLVILVFEFSSCDLAYATDQVGDIFPEFATECVPSHACVFQGVVKDGSHDGMAVQFEFDKQFGDCQRVVDVFFAFDPPLSSVGGCAYLIGSANFFDFLFVKILSQQVAKIFKLPFFLVWYTKTAIQFN